MNERQLTGSVIHYTDKSQVEVKGDWQEKSEVGLRGLFVFKYLRSKADANTSASVLFRLPIEKSGQYTVCLRYKPKKEYAKKAPVIIEHADGKTRKIWDFSKGEDHGFAITLGIFRFNADGLASVTITSENADGPVVADSVGFFKVE